MQSHKKNIFATFNSNHKKVTNILTLKLDFLLQFVWPLDLPVPLLWSGISNVWQPLRSTYVIWHMWVFLVESTHWKAFKNAIFLREYICASCFRMYVPCGMCKTSSLKFNRIFLVSSLLQPQHRSILQVQLKWISEPNSYWQAKLSVSSYSIIPFVVITANFFLKLIR